MGTDIGTLVTDAGTIITLELKKFSRELIDFNKTRVLTNERASELLQKQFYVALGPHAFNMLEAREHDVIEVQNAILKVMLESETRHLSPGDYAPLSRDLRENAVVTSDVDDGYIAMPIKIREALKMEYLLGRRLMFQIVPNKGLYLVGFRMQ